MKSQVNLIILCVRYLLQLMSKNYEVVDGHYDITEALFSRSSGLETNEEMKSLTAFALDGLRDLMKEKLKNQSKRGLLKHKILESETRAVWNDHIKEKSYKLGKNITDAIYNYAMIEWSLHYGQLARNISALLPFFYKELEGSDYYMPGGYSGLLEILTNDIPKCAIKLGKEVQTIHWKNETVLVDYIDGNGTKGSVTADHVIVTVSIAVLQKHHKTLFVPGLTRRKARAIEKLRLGVVNRIYLFYDQQFWTENDFRMCIFWDSSIEQEFKDDGHWFKHINMIEAYDENVLLIWANAYVSEVASSLSNESLGILLTAFIRKVMKNNTIKTPRTVFITNWQEKEHFLGSYSYTAPGQNRLTKNLAMNPLSVKGEPKVLFAGEAMHQTRFGTIDGAYLTGIREAKRILDRNFDKTQ